MIEPWRDRKLSIEWVVSAFDPFIGIWLLEADDLLVWKGGEALPDPDIVIVMPRKKFMS
jgi:hypothetical protein